ncbi:MAG: response regulator transcription factor [Spirochaetia bacterium]
MKILIAEDDRFTRKGLTDIFEQEGYTVIATDNGEKALKLFRIERPDFVCLDIMMPGRNGYDVCRAIRKDDAEVPVIFLSAKSEEIDKVLGLELGADDYISKPFGVKEVIARIRAVTRRSLARNPGERPDIVILAEREPFVMDDLTVFPAELRAEREGYSIDLSLRDVKLLITFAENRGRVLDRNTLYTAGWGEPSMPDSRTLDQHISQLRRKVEGDPKNPSIITTVHAAGYRFPMNR